MTKTQVSPKGQKGSSKSNQYTGIQWTNRTWNPVTGCTKVSPGCKHCYAAVTAKRLNACGQKKYKNGFKVTCHPAALVQPFAWRTPAMVFVNSMSDLFHDDVSDYFIGKVYEKMVLADWHTFQVLTKRPDRVLKLADTLPWPENLWMGVSVESAGYMSRIDTLRQIPAKTRFLSLEPLLGPLENLNLSGIHWVIVGGESGPKFRAMEGGWARDIRDQCLAAGVPFFFKQWGGRTSKSKGNLLDGKTWEQLPN
jgi:protein gp37